MDCGRVLRKSDSYSVLLGVRLLMSYETDQIERIKQRLSEVINKVPERVLTGGVMETRAWMDLRREAERMLKRKVGTAEMLSMISRLQ